MAFSDSGQHGLSIKMLAALNSLLNNTLILDHKPQIISSYDHQMMPTRKTAFNIREGQVGSIR
jgi:hypothetical protein